jgi:Na+-driven multidrug efflux pump
MNDVARRCNIPAVTSYDTFISTNPDAPTVAQNNESVLSSLVSRLPHCIHRSALLESRRTVTMRTPTMLPSMGLLVVLLAAPTTLEAFSTTIASSRAVSPLSNTYLKRLPPTFSVTHSSTSCYLGALSGDGPDSADAALNSSMFSESTEDDESSSLLSETESTTSELSTSSTSTSTAEALDGDDIPSYKTMLVFLSTTILIWLSEPLLSLVDTTVVGQYANVLQLAALGPATMLIDSAIYLTYFLAIATTNTIANALSDKNYRKLQTASSQVLGLAAVLGGMLTALVFGAGRPLLHWASGGSSSPQLIQLALEYCQIRSIVAPLAIVGMVAQSICLASLDTKTPAIAVAVASIVNVVGDLALVPKWGMQGAGVATAAASVASTLVLVRRVKKTMQKWRRQEDEALVGEGDCTAHIATVINGIPILGFSNSTTNRESTAATKKRQVPFVSLPDPVSLMKLLKMAGPIFFCILGKVICYSAMSMRAADFGVTALAAHNVMIRVFFFYSTFGDSVSQASQTFLPRVKTQKSISKLVRRLGVLAAGIGIFNKLMAQAALRQFGSYFTNDASILKLMATHADWAGWALLIHPFIMLGEGCILASQDLIFLLGSYAVTMACHFTQLKVGVASTFGGVWQALFLFQTFRLVQFSWRVWDQTLSKRSKSRADGGQSTNGEAAVVVEAMS